MKDFGETERKRKGDNECSQNTCNVKKKRDRGLNSSDKSGKRDRDKDTGRKRDREGRRRKGAGGTWNATTDVFANSVMDPGSTLREFSKLQVSSSAATQKAERKEKIELWDRQREEERKRGEEARREWEKKHFKLLESEKKN